MGNSKPFRLLAARHHDCLPTMLAVKVGFAQNGLHVVVVEQVACATVAPRAGGVD
jgi:hypothetical protein